MQLQTHMQKGEVQGYVEVAGERKISFRGMCPEVPGYVDGGGGGRVDFVVRRR